MTIRIPGKVGVGFALLATLVLAACQQGPERLAPACPTIAIVQDASELTLFVDGPGRDLIDVTLEARIMEFAGFCDTDLDEDTGAGRVDIDLELLFQAKRGPASANLEAQLSYFVAITDKDEVILARENFTIDLKFEGNRNRIGAVETLAQKIPLKSGEFGEDFKVFVGFQLSEEQLRFNRIKLGR